jgi:hypothetical protein
MVVDVFDSLLQELGKALKIEDLRLDDVNTCLIKFDTGLLVYIEPYKKSDFMLISTNIGELPGGRYREDVFREALKSNGLSNIGQHGIFAYSEQSNRLILFGLLSLRELNGEKIAAFLYPFMEKALVWKNTIESGNVPVADTMKTSRTSGPIGMFGMRP